MPAYTKNRRRNYFIDKSFQAKFIMKFCLQIVVASGLIGWLIYYFNQGTTTVAFDNLKIVVKTTADFILPITVQILVIVTLLTALSTIMVTLLTSHKIAGPLYKLKMELAKMKDRDFSSPIRIRAKDQLQNVVREFDDVRQELKTSLNTLQKQWASLEHMLQDLKEKAPHENIKQQIAMKMKRISTELKAYKTD